MPNKLVIHMAGGIGNQMFQYALGRSLTEKRNMDLSLNISFYDRYNLFPFSLNKFCIKGEIERVHTLYNNKYARFFLKNISKYGFNAFFDLYFEKELFKYDENVFSDCFNEYYGSWQSYKYFHKIYHLIRDDFRLKNPLSKKAKFYMERIIESKSVSIHIRRGDYVKDRRMRRLHGFLSLEYYTKAINYMARDSVFYVFSDDIEWARNALQIKPNMVYVDIGLERPEEEIYLMSLCRNNIISNSTFGWWGAMLNKSCEKIVVAPKKWYLKKSASKDLIFDDWVKI